MPSKATIFSEFLEGNDVIAFVLMMKFRKTVIKMIMDSL